MQEARREKMQQRNRLMLSSVSPAAKELDTKIKNVYSNQSLTKQQTCEQVQELISSATEQIKQELKLKDLECDQ